MSRQNELSVTEHFVDHLNTVSTTAYKALPEQAENSDTDTWIEDQDGSLIPVQNVTSEGTTLRLMTDSTRAIKLGKPLRVEAVEHDKWIHNVLDDKESKHYSNSGKLVLLLRGSLPYPPPEEILALGPIKSSFAGVYYVALPSSSYPEGYVVCLKPFWETSQIF